MDEKEKVTNEVKKEEKVKSKNAVVLLIVLAVALIAIITLVIFQMNMNKTEIGAQGNTEINVEDKEQNVNNDTKINIYQEKVEDAEDKEEQKEEVESKEESQNKNEEVNTESKEPQKEEQEQVKVDFDYIADKLFEAYGIKEEVDKLPQVTDEERPKYEKEWNNMVAEKYDEFVQIIKKKYPTLSDKQAKEYTTKFFQYIKEYGLRIAKQSEQVIEDAQDAIEKADKANALSKLTLKYTEILTNHMQTNPGQSYKPNEQDLKTLQQHVLEESDGKYTVKIKQDNSGYDVVKVAN